MARVPSSALRQRSTSAKRQHKTQYATAKQKKKEVELFVPSIRESEVKGKRELQLPSSKLLMERSLQQPRRPSHKPCMKETRICFRAFHPLVLKSRKQT